MRRCYLCALGSVLLGFVPLAVVLLTACVPTARAEDWPQWRGPNRDGISRETGLAKEWPKDGPPVAWQIETVGVGYSSLAIKDGRIESDVS